ncbi:hypothetical protein C2W62_43965 [Candidatus Entotheonella serta]|nr:hypothetical protein C2W62_43965 [Candidatus Entotheonella serta]
MLATGDDNQVFAQTTNVPVSTGDGVALSWQAGAQLHALTLVPFHPTALTKLGAPHFLISEAVRGERIQVQLWQEVLAAYEVNHFLGQISPAQNVQFACPDSSSRAYGQMKSTLTICKKKGL